MPTYYRLGNVAIRIYPKDHPPAHVHAVAPDAEAKFEIATMKLISCHGFSEAAVKRIQAFLTSRKQRLLEQWNENQE